MVITNDINQFIQRYHNKNETYNISCIIFNNIYHQGISNYIYNDYRKNNNLIYYGQKKGLFDKYIQKNKTIYLEKNKNEEEYTYIGIIENFFVFRENNINRFHIKINKEYICNGVKSGDKLYYINTIKKGKGSYCFKKSAFIRLGLKIQGNLCSGIIPINDK
tara:strand:- start:700 stop:1185 length:486 start_codon:yes stop_codon:yes gene_type:complete